MPMPRARGRFRQLLLCFALQGGVLVGVPMRPDEIQSLMRSLSRPTIEHVVRDEEKDGGRGGDDPPEAVTR